MNQFYGIGNVVRDPEVRTTNAGIKVCNFTIAINRRMKNNGEQQTDFLNIVAWRQLAESEQRQEGRCNRFHSGSQLRRQEWY